MKRFFQVLILGLTGYGFWASGGWGTGLAVDSVLWNHYAHTAVAASQAAASNTAPAHPLVTEPMREAPATPPPARLFISAEGRYAIQQGWLTGEEYEENKIASHVDAVAMLMRMTGLDPTRPLTQQDFINYLGFVFPHLPEEGLLELSVDTHREITLAEMARAAYRLRGLNPHLP